MDRSELARELAQDETFRKRLLSAIGHGSEAARRARGGFGLKGAIERLMTDQRLLSELRAARKDLQRAYTRVEAKKRSHKLRKLLFFAALASVVGVPQIRQRVAEAIARVRNYSQPTTESGERQPRPSRLEELTKDELYARAQEADIAGRSEMSKEELIAALRASSHAAR